MHYLKRGAAPRPLAPPARRIRPPLASLPRAGAGVAARQLMHTQELLEKIESNMVTEEVSFAITKGDSPRRSEATPMLGTLPVLLL